MWTGAGKWVNRPYVWKNHYEIPLHYEKVDPDHVISRNHNDWVRIINGQEGKHILKYASDFLLC